MAAQIATVSSRPNTDLATAFRKNIIRHAPLQCANGNAWEPISAVGFAATAAVADKYA
ncbi:hypothetical protein LAB1_18460 [Roseibium sp. LAB1]